MAVRLPPSLRVLQRDWLSSNNIVFLDDEREATVVDSGYVTHREQTVGLVRHSIGARRLTRLVNTHCHSDHIGGNAALARAFGCSVSIPQGEVENVRAWDEEALHLASFGQRCERFEFDSTVLPGAVLNMGGIGWQAISAPGHDMDALVFFAPEERVLISGDALWEDGFGVLFPELFGEPGLAATRGTLDTIAALKPRVVIPGHGKVFDEVDAALERAYRRLEAFERDPEKLARNAFRVLVVFHILDRQAVTLEQVATMLQNASFFAALNERSYRLAPAALAEKLVNDLLGTGVLRLDEGMVRPG
jgi:glyoxylase-like metal-dependent hydrolase (beta-lactamase superfamily II)